MPEDASLGDVCRAGPDLDRLAVPEQHDEFVVRDIAIVRRARNGHSFEARVAYGLKILRAGLQLAALEVIDDLHVHAAIDCLLEFSEDAVVVEFINCSAQGPMRILRLTDERD